MGPGYKHRKTLFLRGWGPPLLLRGSTKISQGK